MTASAPLPPDPEPDVLATGKKVASAAGDLGRFAGLGLQFTATLAVCGGLGWWLDTLFGTFPWLLVAGVLGGGVIAFGVLVRAVPSSKAPTLPTSETRAPHDPRP